MLPLLLQVEPSVPGDANYWREVSRHFSQGADVAHPRWFVVVAAAFALLMVLIWFRAYLQQRSLKSKPLMTFHVLAEELGLSLGQQWLLVRIARQQGLPSPLTLMLSSGTLRHHADRFFAAGRDRPALRRRLRQIESLLFETP